jgi:hypothetical protein
MLLFSSGFIAAQRYSVVSYDKAYNTHSVNIFTAWKNFRVVFVWSNLPEGFFMLTEAETFVNWMRSINPQAHTWQGYATSDLRLNIELRQGSRRVRGIILDVA